MWWTQIDRRIVIVMLALMMFSLAVISSMTLEEGQTGFWTPYVKGQLRWYMLGWLSFFMMTYFDYQKLREWSPFLYGLAIVLLVGLFFVSPIQNVHRWYRIPYLASIQPSEQGKIVVILFVSWFLERKEATRHTLWTALQVGLIVGLPFLLILKQPDLGTALTLYPIMLVIGYMAKMHRGVLKGFSWVGVILLGGVLALFLGVTSHDKARPLFTSFIKEYQYERLNPETYHQRASQTALAIGGVTGLGWQKGFFSRQKWLPAAHTDSVFAALGEEFGMLGIAFLLFLFYAMVYCSFQVALVAKDLFGALLAGGLAAYVAMHVLFNAAMMCALLPISGVPLILVTYGGSSLVTTMAALGLLQSIYIRRFTFQVR
jgi:rod shape determining protein RodA